MMKKTQFGFYPPKELMHVITSSAVDSIHSNIVIDFSACQAFEVSASTFNTPPTWMNCIE